MFLIQSTQIKEQTKAREIAENMWEFFNTVVLFRLKKTNVWRPVAVGAVSTASRAETGT